MATGRWAVLRISNGVADSADYEDAEQAAQAFAADEAVTRELDAWAAAAIAAVDDVVAASGPPLVALKSAGARTVEAHRSIDGELEYFRVELAATAELPGPQREA